MTTEQKILSTARRLFSSRIYVDVSIMDIVIQAGVARGSFYNYFSTKDECFVQAVLPVIREITDYYLRMKHDNISDSDVIEQKCLELFLNEAMAFRNSFSFMLATESAVLRELLYSAFKNMNTSIYDYFLSFMKKQHPDMQEGKKKCMAEILYSSVNTKINEIMLNTVGNFGNDIAVTGTNSIKMILDMNT